MSARALQALFSRQFVVFIAGGLLSALVDIGSMGFLLRMQAPVFTATSCGFLLGLVVNYAFHARMTFSAPSTVGSVVRFLVIVGINYALTLAFVLVFNAFLASPLLGKVASLPAVAVNGFLLSKFWVFR